MPVDPDVDVDGSAPGEPTADDLAGPTARSTVMAGGRPFRPLGGAFAVGGERYEQLRPGYPPRAVEWLTEGTPGAGVVVDVGAGTGKLTAALLAEGFEVVAVDPSLDMLAQLRHRLPTVATQVGTGEATGLPDGSADLVTFAQSWHWVEPDAGSAETARVLRPGGGAGWLWNFVDDRVPWVAGLADVWHTLAGAEAGHATHLAPVLGGAFGPVDALTVDWVQPMTLVDLAALVTTRSYYLSASAPERHQVETRAAAYLAAELGGADTVQLPYRTYCFRARTPG